MKTRVLLATIILAIALLVRGGSSQAAVQVEWIFAANHSDAATVPASTSFDDEFDGPDLDSRWSWVREDSTHWSLTARPGYLRITTQRGDIHGETNNLRNLLIQEAPEGDFDITTLLSIDPYTHAQQAGLLVYQDDDNYIRLTRGYMFASNYVEFILEQNGNPTAQSVEVENTTVHLTISRRGTVYTGSYSLDGVTWVPVGEYREVSLQQTKIGISSWNGDLSAAEIPADFDFFHVTSTSPPTVERGVVGDCWADVIIGQPDFSQITPNEVVGYRLFNPGGIHVDVSAQPNRIYVYDAGNNRVLGLSHLGVCLTGINEGQNCTTDTDCSGSSCQILEDNAADIVLGQPSFSSSACNGDSGLQNYPDIPSARADTLCGMLVTGVSIAESGSGATMATDADGNLYIPDVYNHRVLRYDNPFTHDTQADYVWGQLDFSGNECNRGASYNYPDNKSLCLAPPPFNGDIIAGVAIDLEGNLWVADNRNNRVLRFPFDSSLGVPAQEADLVLGQPDFTTATSGTGLDQMDKPASVRVDSSGVVYVADSANNRVLVFEPPFSNGMVATNLLGDSLKRPTGLEIDPNSGGIWVNDSDSRKFLHFVNGVVQDAVDIPDGRAWGGLGVDSESNIMGAGWDLQQGFRFSAPTYTTETTFLPAEKPGHFNQTGPRGLYEGMGLEVTNGQLIVGDGSRMLFWNNPWRLTNFQAADGVIGEPDFQSRDRWTPHFHRMRADSEGRLWVIEGNWQGSEIHAYQLPLTTGAEPIITISSPLPLQGGGVFTWTWTLNLGGIDVQPGCDCLWLSDSDSHRVFRIRDVSSPQRVVDIVLGQKDASGIHCNHGRDSDDGYVHPTSPTQDSLCHPGALAFDQEGNLYLADHNLELAGNWRLLEFDADTLPDAPTTAVFGIPATRVYGRNGSFTEPNCLPLEQDPMCGPWEPAFDSKDGMIIGFNGYLGPRFPQVYENPLINPLPTSELCDFHSQPVSTRFDQFDNLYVLDGTRHRISIYFNADMSELYLPLVRKD